MIGPRPSRAEVPWVPDFTYACTGGHVVQADQHVDRCPVAILGEACTGELTRVGKGSRTAARATVDA